MRLAELAIPPEAEFVSVARLVVSSVVGDRYEILGDQLESLKLAVSEVCSYAIDSRPADGTIAIECNGAKDRVAVSVNSVEGLQTEANLVPFIQSLVDEVDFVEPGTTGGVRLTVYCEPAEPL